MGRSKGELIAVHAGVMMLTLLEGPAYAQSVEQFFARLT